MSEHVDDSTVADWWATSITKMAPGVIAYRDVPISEVISDYGFIEVVWLMLRAERPSEEQVRLLEAALVAAADHGPQAPSIAAARMAATCGVGLNNAVATGVNLLGDVHGGAGQQCMELLAEVLRREAQGDAIDDAADATLQAWRSEYRYIPGFGHRFHPVDPRREPLIELVTRARDGGHIPGDHLRAGLAVEKSTLALGKSLPINIDGLTAIIYGELGFPPPLARGLFVLSRSVGILAHAWEESQSGRRNKGPLPPSILPTYRGPAGT
ncbi:MAG TPA: citryl-CoA lyase [Jiangellaceae bacterium]